MCPKKFYSTILLLLLIVLLCAACSGGQTEAASEGTASEETASEEAVSEDAQSEKITLTLARRGDSIWPAVSEFNLSQDKYVIEVVDYSNNKALSRAIPKGFDFDLEYWNSANLLRGTASRSAREVFAFWAAAKRITAASTDPAIFCPAAVAKPPRRGYNGYGKLSKGASP